MKKVIVLALVLIVTHAYSQQSQREINEHVWKPFIKSFSERDTKSFMTVHSRDLIRSSRDSKTILTWEEYNAQSQKWDEQEKNSKSRREIELRFTERIASKDRAIEVGVYKTSYIEPDGKTRSFFGRFHVVLRKENGAWKILVDTDSSENNTISEKDFLTAAAIE
jgi:ketosteroid isomerase-like protein